MYMLLCSDSGPIYVKVGITDDLYGRLRTLRNGCPVTPRRFCTMEFPSRRKARTAERALHIALEEWNAHGEWFLVKREDKAAFNEAWRIGLAGLIDSQWPAKWDQIPVQALIEAGDQRQRYMARKIMRRGKAFHDACQQGLKSSEQSGR